MCMSVELTSSSDIINYIKNEKKSLILEGYNVMRFKDSIRIGCLDIDMYKLKNVIKEMENYE